MSRVAIVTGGGSGIGRAVGLALGRAGWRVVLAGRREAALNVQFLTVMATKMPFIGRG